MRMNLIVKFCSSLSLSLGLADPVTSLPLPQISLGLLLLNYADDGEEALSSETREELALFLLKEIKVSPPSLASFSPYFRIKSAHPHAYISTTYSITKPRVDAELAVPRSHHTLRPSLC